jgi:hypothetical protein
MIEKNCIYEIQLKAYRAFQTILNKSIPDKPYRAFQTNLRNSLKSNQLKKNYKIRNFIRNFQNFKIFILNSENLVSKFY